MVMRIQDVVRVRVELDGVFVEVNYAYDIEVAVDRDGDLASLVLTKLNTYIKKNMPQDIINYLAGEKYGND